MKIQIINDIAWDTEHLENTEARQWVAENVLGEAASESDRFGRPLRWTQNTDTAVITVTREYINPNSGSWARKRDVITVEQRGGAE